MKIVDFGLVKDVYNYRYNEYYRMSRRNLDGWLQNRSQKNRDSVQHQMYGRLLMIKSSTSFNSYRYYFIFIALGIVVRELFTLGDDLTVTLKTLVIW